MQAEGRAVTDVKVLADWSGWCDPCEVERPLVLTEHGRRGVRAWLSGIHHEDRTLHLTCRVCGLYQVVARLEEDDPEVDVAPPTVPLILATALRPARSVVVASKPAGPKPDPADLPAPRRPRPMVLTVKQHEASVLSLLAEGFDVVPAGR